MVVKGDQEKIRALLKDTITLLCKNGLNYNAEFCIEALIGITLDKDDVFLVSINETVKNGLLEAKGADSDLEAVSVDAEHVVSHQPRKRRGPSMQPQHRGGTMTPRVKAEQHSDDDGQDIQENVDYSPHVDITTPPPGKRRRGPVERRPLVKQEHARGNSWGSAPQGQDDQTENNSFMATVGSGDAMGGVSEDADLSHVLHSGALVPLSGQTEDGANWTDTSMHSTSENVTDVNDPNQVGALRGSFDTVFHVAAPTAAAGVRSSYVGRGSTVRSAGVAQSSVDLHHHLEPQSSALQQLDDHVLVKIPRKDSNKRRQPRRCRVCYKLGLRKMTSLLCQNCPNTPALCPGRCFDLYHSDSQYRDWRSAVMFANLEDVDYLDQTSLAPVDEQLGDLASTLAYNVSVSLSTQEGSTNDAIVINTDATT